MRRQSFAFCCCFTLLFVASSSKPREDSTTGDERNNSTVRYEVHANVITTNHSDDAKAVHYDMHKNSTRNNVQHEFRGNFMSDVHDNGSMQYEFHSTKDHGDGDQAPAEFRVVNSTRADNESNSTSHIEPSENLMQVENRSNLTTYEHLGKLSQDDNRNVVPYEMCENSTCIPLCCPLGSRMVGEKNCTEENANYLFPDVYEFDFGTNQSIPIGKKVDQVFQLSHHDPCGSRGRYLLVPNEMPHDVYRFLVNGSLYLPYKMKFIDSYCLIPWTSNKYEIAVCFEKEELSENLMQADGSNLTSYAQLGKLFQDDNRNVVPYEMCENSTCIPLCCPLGNRMVEEKCIKTNGSYLFPDVYEFDFDTNQSIPIGKKVDQVFQLSHHDPCGPPGRYLLFPNKMPHDVYRFLVNGSLYQPHWMTFIDSYCLLAWNSNEYQIAVCYEEELPVPEKDPPPSVHIGYPVGLLISLPFLLSTFIVYSILPELWNMHGYTLRGYIGSLFVAYIFLAVHQLADQKKISDTFCIISGTAYNNTMNAVYIK